MRQTTVVYVCDRCGAKHKFDGETASSEQRLKTLGSAGWCTVRIGSITGLGPIVTRHLCRSCMEGLSDHLDKATPLP